MFGLPGIIVVYALGGIPLDPQPSNESGFRSLCHGQWMHADANASYRGVEVEDNGSGKCCLLDDRHSFVCEMSPGHQHGPVVTSHLRFYDGVHVRPRVDLIVYAAPNPGMNPDPAQPVRPPFASLRLQKTRDGFVLLPESKSSCDRSRGPAQEVCASAGVWVLVDGIPQRL